MAPRFDRQASADGPVVQGFAGRGFTVDGGVYEGLFLTPVSAHQWDAPVLDALTMADLEPVLALDPAPQFLLLGTGRTTSFPPPALRRALEARDIGLEVMDSRAAARTWGLLRAEDRWITAALMPL